MKETNTQAKIEIVRLTEALVDDVGKLLCLCFPRAERYLQAPWNYSGKPMTGALLKQKVLSNKLFDPEGTFIVLLAGKIVGCCLTVIKKSEKLNIGFICAFAVDPCFRRQGIGELLLNNTEQYFQKHQVKRSTFSFESNPMALYGGIQFNDDGYTFFLNHGFRSCENSILLLLSQDTSRFILTNAMQTLIIKLKDYDINIVLLNASLIDRVDQFLAVNFEGWRESIIPQFLKNPLPQMLIAVQGERVIGYAGPYSVTDSGLGNFHSIGVASSERGKGLGAVLFHLMCANLKSGGAKSTALSVSNVGEALELYIRADFKVRYAVDFKMKKEY